MMASSDGRREGRGGCFMMLLLFMTMMMMYLHDAYGFEEKATIVDPADSTETEVTYFEFNDYSQFNLSFDTQVSASGSLVCFARKWLTSEDGRELQIPKDINEEMKKMLKEGVGLEKNETGWLQLDVPFKLENRKTRIEMVKAWFHLRNAGHEKTVIRAHEAERLLKHAIESCLYENHMRSEIFRSLKASMKVNARRVLPTREERVEVWYDVVHVELERSTMKKGKRENCKVNDVMSLRMVASSVSIAKMEKQRAGRERHFEKLDLGGTKCKCTVNVISHKLVHIQNLGPNVLVQLQSAANQQTFEVSAYAQGKPKKEVLLAAAYGLLRFKEAIARNEMLPFQLPYWFNLLKQYFFEASILYGDLRSSNFNFKINYLYHAR